MKGAELVPGKHRTIFKIYTHTHTPALLLPSAARSQAPSGRKMHSILPNNREQLEDHKSPTELPHTSPHLTSRGTNDPSDSCHLPPTISAPAQVSRGPGRHRLREERCCLHIPRSIKTQPCFLSSRVRETPYFFYYGAQWGTSSDAWMQTVEFYT